MSNILKIAASGVEAAPTGYQISRSLRFNSADTAYLSRTPAGAGNRKTWTWSAWVKRGALGIQTLFYCDNGVTDATFGLIAFNSANNLAFGAYNVGWRVTTQVFRDPSAWYHIVVAFDTTQATAANRVKIYVNGVQVTAFSDSNDPTLNTDYGINQAAAHNIGKDLSSYGYFSGYLTEIHFVDGQALTPSDFGETDATTGVWKPKAYTGTYGTNGFYLNFSDNTSTTTLGEDQAGSNNWTLNNFSVAAGAGNDSLVDTPTPYGTDTGVGGEVRGNYCTLNPLEVITGSSFSFAQGNLFFVGGNTGTIGTMGIPTTGKWYWEGTIAKLYDGGANDFGGAHGVYKIKDINPYVGTYASYAYINTNSSARGVYKNGVRVEAVSGAATNDVIGCAYDADTLSLQFYRNGSAYGSAITLDADEYIPFTYANGNNTTDGAQFNYNFGQRPFAYTAPSGFKALCTQNLPTPTVVQGDDYFNTVLYTGTGSSQSITGVGFQPDWVWIKERSGVADHGLYDAVRGVQNQLESNTTTAETAEATGLTAFGSDGFTVGALAQLNTNTDTYVAWNWNAGGSNATNTDGTITSTVRANPTAGFSIVSYTGNGTRSGQTVGHGLGVAPSMIIHKPRSTTGGWFVTHSGIPNAWILLNSTDASATGGGTNGTLNYQSTNTTTVFSFIDGSSSINNVNGSGTTYIAYCFAEIEGYSKFGSYTGNGSTDGSFVYCGFRPAFVMLKRTDSSTGADWFMWDATRNTFNVVGSALFADLNNAEIAYTALDFLSNGFKLRSSDVSWNGSSATYIFMAFAKNPVKFSLAR